MSCGVGQRPGSDLALQWLWHRPAAIALSEPLAWEPPYAAGMALKSKKQTKKETPIYHLSYVITNQEFLTGIYYVQLKFFFLSIYYAHLHNALNNHFPGTTSN